MSATFAILALISLSGIIAYAPIWNELIKWEIDLKRRRDAFEIRKAKVLARQKEFGDRK